MLKKPIITARHLPESERVIIQPDCSQPRTNCIVTARSTICARRSVSLDAVIFLNVTARNAVANWVFWELGFTKENPLENTVNARILPEVRMSAPPLEANTCCCDWLLLQDPGAVSILVLLCITETQDTFSQKDSFANHVRWSVNEKNSWPLRSYGHAQNARNMVMFLFCSLLLSWWRPFKFCSYGF